MEVHLVRACLLLLGRLEPDAELGAITRQQRDAVGGVVGKLPAQDTCPELREKGRVVRVEAERDEVRGHNSSPPCTGTASVLPGGASGQVQAGS